MWSINWLSGIQGRNYGLTRVPSHTCHLARHLAAAHAQAVLVFGKSRLGTAVL